VFVSGPLIKFCWFSISSFTLSSVGLVIILLIYFHLLKLFFFSI
jgi:hypothetical protein